MRRFHAARSARSLLLLVAAGLAAGFLAGCGTPDPAAAGDEWTDSTRSEVQCATAPRILGLAAQSASLARFADDAAAGAALVADGTLAGRAWAATDRVFSDLTGRLYVVDAAGSLSLVRIAADGAADAGLKLADGWGGFRTVAAAGDGVLYAIDTDGAVHWYRHSDPDAGPVTWTDGSGNVIGDGFGSFTQLVSGGDGVLYALDAAGDLRWYLHLDPDEGAAGWSPDSGNVIASGWNLSHVTSAGDGVLYGVDPAGQLVVYRHEDPAGGSADFSEDSGRVVAQGFAQFGTVAAYTPSCEMPELFVALVHWGMYPAASDAYRTLGLAAWRIVQTIGNAPASAGYHARDGYANGQPYTAATDISVRGLSRTFIRRLLERMGRVGFAAFYRWPGHDGWPASEVEHIHAVYAGCKMKSQLRGQVYDWLDGRDGLANHGLYRFTSFSIEAKRKVRCLFGLGCVGGGSSGGGSGNGSGDGSGGSCVAGGYYCGGDKVSGDARTLYRCNGSGAPTLVERCASSCAVVPGHDDVCRAAGACFKGGSYCGGDKVNGDPSTLYRCDGTSSPNVIAHCSHGCAVRSGQDDACQ